MAYDIEFKKSNNIARGQRRRLPPRRGGFTDKYVVDGHSIYIRTGEYEDKTLGEIWINLSREGSTVRSLSECFAKAISLGIQYGVPVEEYVEAFIFTKFEPAGIVEDSDDISLCSSIVDLVFRVIGIHYLGRNDLSNKRQIQSLTKTGLVEIAPAPTVHIPVKDINVCWDCGNASLVRAGTCLQCTTCGASTGCG